MDGRHMVWMWLVGEDGVGWWQRGCGWWMLGMERREGEDHHICVRSLLPGATDAGVVGGFPAERSYSDTVFPFVFGHSVSTTRLGLVALARVLEA